MASKKKLETTMRIPAYTVIDRVVEDAVRLGFRRARKHSEHPDPPDLEHLQDTISQVIMDELCEVIDFGD